MASTTALYTGLSGLNANARRIDVAGNNIANVNTTAFKGSRAVFSDVLYRTSRAGAPPDGDSGGVNPTQVGFGVKLAGTQRDFRTGGLSATGNSQDLAIDGSGFFVVERDGRQFFTRDGSFRLDSNFNMTNVFGDRLQGFGVDQDFNIVEGAVGDLSVPVGALTVAEATTEARLVGNLNTAGDVAVSGTSIDLGVLTGAPDSGAALTGLTLIPGATVPPGAGAVIEPTSLLTEIADPTSPDPADPAPLLAAGERIRVEGAGKGTGVLPGSELLIDATTTVQDLMTFLSRSLGIQPATGANGDGLTPGVTIDPATGVLSVVGNEGEANALDIESRDIRVFNGAGVARSIFDPRETGQASGESVRTSTVVYDSLGNEVRLDVSFVLDSTEETGTTWRYFVESSQNGVNADPTLGGLAADGLPGLAVASGLVSFDTSGGILTPESVPILIDRAGTGAESPLTFDLRFGDPTAGGSDSLTALADQQSTIAATFRDGAPIGTLEDFSVAPDGTIFGAFSNTLVRPLGQVALAQFANPGGLEALGDNLYRPGPNSGDPGVTPPGGLATGRVIGGTLEQSNVDIGEEFVGLLLAQTGYTASSRVISTTDDLMQQLLALVR